MELTIPKLIDFIISSLLMEKHDEIPEYKLFIKYKKYSFVFNYKLFFSNYLKENIYHVLIAINKQINPYINIYLTIINLKINI